MRFGASKCWRIDTEENGGDRDRRNCRGSMNRCSGVVVRSFERNDDFLNLFRIKSELNERSKRFTIESR